MRQLVLLVTVAAVVTVVLSGTAFTQSCFGEYASQPEAQPLSPPPPGPGTFVNKPVTTLAAPGAVDELAREVGFVNQVRPCPPEATSGG
jgi:hypothetical protein